MGRKKSGDFIDGKVIAVVRKYIQENGMPSSDEVVLRYVLSNLIEYRRKPQKLVLKMVAKALEICQGEVPEHGTPGMEKIPRKRMRDDPETSDDATTPNPEAGELSDDELQARAVEQMTPRHNLLNASIALQNKMSGQAKAKEEKKTKAAKEKQARRSRAGTPGGQWGTATLTSDYGEGGGGGSLLSERPRARYADLGGAEAVLGEIRELVERPLLHPEVYEHLGVTPPRGVLLHGPPGCGKTLLATAVAGELGVSFFKVSAPEIVSGMSGESESKVRRLFQEAKAVAPSIIFLDEIDAITPKRETSQRGMDKRIVAQLLTCLDDLEASARGSAPVVVLGATNRPDALDLALRRAGRFDREIALGVPTQEARAAILRRLTAGMRLAPSCAGGGAGGGGLDFELLAKKTPGYVGADLAALAREAAAAAVRRCFRGPAPAATAPAAAAAQEPAAGTPEEGGGEGCGGAGANGAGGEERGDGSAEEGGEGPPAAVAQGSTGGGRAAAAAVPLTAAQLAPLYVSMGDFLEATGKVQPTAKREGFATVPDVTWADVGALDAVRAELSLAVLEPIAYPERFEALGLAPAAGVLLYGPPGCGKTLLAKAVAHESGANFISVKGPELLDKYVGQSERAVRQVFERARASSPCVIFFDELDSLCPKRGAGGENGGVTERVVNQLLTEMDGLEARRQTWVIAATNRPELIDPAMLRPGRLDKLLYVPLPAPGDREAILRANVKPGSLSGDVDLAAVGRDARAEGYSGADLAALCREAALDVLRHLHTRLGTAGAPVPAAAAAAALGGGGKEAAAAAAAPLHISAANFEAAFGRVRPSVSRESRRAYRRLQAGSGIRRLRASSLSAHEEGGGGGGAGAGQTPPPPAEGAGQDEA